MQLRNAIGVSFAGDPQLRNEVGVSLEAICNCGMRLASVLNRSAIAERDWRHFGGDPQLRNAIGIRPAGICNWKARLFSAEPEKINADKA